MTLYQKSVFSVLARDPMLSKFTFLIIRTSVIF
uniref:Uncharacterized protein n=1 Tax=Anguilla anguilla TaxID=7936 RepID=A0A0E9WER0_ANGAN